MTANDSVKSEPVVETDQADIEVVKPLLQFAVLCDGVTQPGPDGKVALVGIFDKLLRPGVMPVFTLALGWKNGKGSFKTMTKVLRPDLTVMIVTPEMNFTLNHETDAHRDHITFSGVHFSDSGVYWLEILLDEETVMSIPLLVDGE